MSEKEVVKAWVTMDDGCDLDGRYLVRAFEAIEMAKMFDELNDQFKEKGDRERIHLVSREVFVRSVLDWEIKLDVPCNDDAKRKFYNAVPGIGQRIIEKAAPLLLSKKRESLGNLLTGAGGS